MSKATLPAPRRLNKAEIAGLLAAQQQIEVARAQFREIVTDLGLDPDVPFHLSPDGTVTLDLPGED